MLRALLIFGTLSVTFIGMAVHLALRELNLQAMVHHFDLGRAEAERIASAVAALGRERTGIDFSRIRQKQEVLEGLIAERISVRPFVRSVEVRDRFGGTLLFVTQETRRGRQLVYKPRITDFRDLPAAGTQVVTAQLRRGAVPQGEVRVGIAEEAVVRELEQLRRSLWIKVIVAAACGVLVLALGLWYVIFLVRKNRRLEQSQLAAERRSYVGLLASGLAHEIRNPLNAMNMNLQMLEEELVGVPSMEDGEHGELLESTKSEIKRLESLVNNFLAYARPSDPTFESADLKQVVEEVARFLQADFRQSDVELALDLEPMLPHVELDPTQFKQALMNLLVNARQVMRGGGRVTVATHMGPGGEAVVEVRDNGPGIPEEVRGRVFDLFYSNRGGGTGLGLPIAKQIVERHGGTIEVKSKKGEGTTFVIRLPRRHATAGTSTSAAPATS
jgi:signal transduction histidine kinase